MIVTIVVALMLFNDMADIQMTPVQVKMKVSFPQEKKFKEGVYGLKGRSTCRYVTIKVNKSRPCQSYLPAGTA